MCEDSENHASIVSKKTIKIFTTVGDDSRTLSTCRSARRLLLKTYELTRSVTTTICFRTADVDMQNINFVVLV